MRRKQAVGVLAGLAVAAAATVVVTTQLTPGANEPLPASTAVISVATEQVADDRVPADTPDSAAARGILERLVRADPRADLPAYERSAFGSSWADPDHNGCDGRDDALGQWLHVPVTRGSCVVTGSFTDPYTGVTLSLPDKVDIDHVVPLKEAWRSGAVTWTAQRRVAFHNDLRHLIPVSASANRQKADKPADRWLPRREYWCSYARVYVGIKGAYELTVTSAEAQVLEAALNLCPDSAGSPTGR